MLYAKKNILAVFSAVVLFNVCLWVDSAAAVVKTYSGPDGGLWNAAANWSPVGVPVEFDDVIISSTTVQSVTVSPTHTIKFNSLTIDPNSTLDLYGSVSNAGSVTVAAGAFFNILNASHISVVGDVSVNGTIQTILEPSTLSAIDIEAQNFYIGPFAELRADGTGYGRPLSYVGDGNGPGYGLYSAAGSGGGANGGNGGNGTGANGGVSYCDLSDVATIGAGSSGGAVMPALTIFKTASHGGGFIKLVARNTLDFNGKIYADGGVAGSTDSGGGSGGSIYIEAKTVTGTPSSPLYARGGAGGVTSGGGGGCVLIRYGVTSSITVSDVNVSGGTGVNNGATGQKALQQSLRAPINFGASANTSSIYFTWESDGGAGDTYSLEKSLDGTSYTVVNTFPLSTTNTIVNGLIPATKYFFRIASVSSTLGTSVYVVRELYTFPVDFPAPTISNLTNSSASVQLLAGVNPITSNLRVEVGATSTLGTVRFNSSGQITNNFLLVDFYPFLSWGGSIYGLTPSTTYYIFARSAFQNGVSSTLVSAGLVSSTVTTTPLATPSTPTIGLVSTSTIGLTWTQNGNPATTPYAVYNTTLNQYHLADGSLSPTPTFYPLSSWNGKAKNLTPGTKYLFQIVLRNEDGTQNATSTQNGTYTNNADGTPFSLGGSSSGSSSGGASTTASMGSTTSTGWYFGTPGSSTTYPNTPGSTTTTPPPFPIPTGGTTAYYLPDGTLITPQLIFQMMMNNAYYGTTPSNLPSVSLYKGKNLSSNILFSKFSTQANPLKVGSTLSFRYTYQNPNKTGLYRVERVLLNPQGKVVARSVISSRTITFGQTITYNPSQYFSTTLSTGLYTMRVRITSLDTKTIYDENSFEVSVKK